MSQCPNCGAHNPGFTLECACGQQVDLSRPTPAADPVEEASQASTGAGRTLPDAPAVLALVAVNVSLFALEALWGGSESSLTLHRMGAGLGRTSLVHEPWRVISAAFLHIGILHLLLNMWALLTFGSMLEVALGTRRFLVLYAASAAGGGLASSLVHATTLSAGASGAVWGLMAGQVALVLRLNRQQGAERAPNQMSKLMQPLVVNLLYSFSPGIDMAAHLGGGLAGAGLILSGLIGWQKPEPTGWRPAAWAASLIMAASLVVALASGRPWELRRPPTLAPRSIAGTPVTIPIPGGLLQEPSSQKGETVFGHVDTDPLIVFCSVTPDAPVPDEERPAYLAEGVRNLTGSPLAKGQSWDKPPHVAQLRGRSAVAYTVRYTEGVRIHTWMVAEGPWFVRLDVQVRDDAPASWAALPAAIADGIAINPETQASGRP